MAPYGTNMRTHMLILRQDSEKLGKSRGKWKRETAEHNGRALYSQIQKVTSLKITLRPQLYFSSRPKKPAKPGGLGQDQLQ